MPLRATRFTDEYEALSALTGDSPEDLIAERAEDGDAQEWWLACDEDRAVGLMRTWRSPDGRHTLAYGPCVDPAAYRLLAAQVPGEVFTTVDAAETVALGRLAAAGFTAVRFENRYAIPVDRLEAPVPAGLRIVSAADTELEPLMALDCALRRDVPGCAGWQPDPDWFREENYDSPYFDPETYLVALDGPRYVGLVRIWNGPRPLPRLGLIGVLPPYRRRGLAQALIARAFAVLHARGESEATAEADHTNTASTTLLRRLSGVVTGTDVELRRAAT